MKKLILIGCVCICLFTSMVATKNVYPVKATALNATLATYNIKNNEINYWVDSLYTRMHLSVSGLNRDAFYNACKGYEYLLSQRSIQKPGLITICDFSQPSNKKRLYVLDLNSILTWHTAIIQVMNMLLIFQTIIIPTKAALVSW